MAAKRFRIRSESEFEFELLPKSISQPPKNHRKQFFVSALPKVWLDISSNRPRWRQVLSNSSCRTPRHTQDTPRRTQDVSKTPEDAPNTLPRRQSRAQDTPKTRPTRHRCLSLFSPKRAKKPKTHKDAPRRLQQASKTPQDAPGPLKNR